MKIVAMETLAVEVPFRPVHKAGSPSPRSRPSLPMLFVRVDTDEGVTGWGEAFAFNLGEATRAVLETTVIPRCVGEDPTRIAELMLGIRREFRNSKAGTLTFALSAVDIALWDIAGKMAGVPLHRLLGGGSRGAIPAYASLVRFGDPGVAAEKAVEAMERGYRHIKLHESAVAPIAAARRAVGDALSIMVDASSGWTVQEAIELARPLKDLGVAWLEEPTWPPEDYRALARVAREGRISIAAGENAISVTDFHALCETAEATVAQPSVCKLGGITEVRKAVVIAEALNVSVVPHVYYLGPGLLASLHLVASSPREKTLVEHAVFDIETDPYAGQIDLADGALPVPDTPGLGLDPDPDFLARHARP